MEYLSSRETAAKWGCSLREVQRLLASGRIEGAGKYGGCWLVPANAKKPVDPRRLQGQSKGKGSAYIFLTALPLAKNEPDSTLSSLDEGMRLLAAADIAYRRGNSEPAKEAWRKTANDNPIKLSAASLATAASISSGDYVLYNELQLFLQERLAETNSEKQKAILSLPKTLAAVSMAACNMTPEWLKRCDFSLFPYELRPFLLYLYTLHLRNTGQHEAMLANAEATLVLCEKAHTFTWMDVYLTVLCASASHSLGDLKRSKEYLHKAVSLGLPFGLIAPFADYLGELGGMLEPIVEQRYPEYIKPITRLWNSSFKNWMDFHNRFARDNITTVLSPQEYQTAYLIAHGSTYAETARRMSLSVSRIKNILTEIYGKLYISGKQELSSFIL